MAGYEPGHTPRADRSVRGPAGRGSGYPPGYGTGASYQDPPDYGYGYGEAPPRPPGDRYQRPSPHRPPGGTRRRDATGGADGNERLTALTGAALLILLAAEGVTILAIHQLLTLHFFIGMLLVGPVLLKAGSTVYRFVRYYTGEPGYRRKGPPNPLLRLLGPFVLGLSLLVVGSGVMLAVTGPGTRIWVFAHKASFVLWFMAMGVHVLAYIWRLPGLISGDLVVTARDRAVGVLGGRRARLLLLAASLVCGLLLALATYRQAGAWAGFGGDG
jgi:hypothetical protein